MEVDQPQTTEEICYMDVLGSAMPSSHMSQHESRKVAACDRAMCPMCPMCQLILDHRAESKVNAEHFRWVDSPTA